MLYIRINNPVGYMISTILIRWMDILSLKNNNSNNKKIYKVSQYLLFMAIKIIHPEILLLIVAFQKKLSKEI